MKLIYCTQEGIKSAIEYGRQRWGAVDVETVKIPITTRMNAQSYYDKLALETFDGIITSIDPEDEEGSVFFEAYDHLRDIRREFEAIGDPASYHVGRAFVVRYILVTKMKGSAPDVIHPYEVWLEV